MGALGNAQNLGSAPDPIFPANQQAGGGAPFTVDTQFGALEPGNLPPLQGGTGRSLGDLQSLTSETFFKFLGGGAEDFTKLQSDIRGAGQSGLIQQQGDIRERLGGLGLRFSTPLIREEQQAAKDFELGVAGQTAPLAFQGLQQARGQQQKQLGTALGLPAQFQSLQGQAFQEQIAPLLMALQFAGGFAPVGQKSSSKSAGASVGGK